MLFPIRIGSRGFSLMSSTDICRTACSKKAAVSGHASLQSRSFLWPDSRIRSRSGQSLASGFCGLVGLGRCRAEQVQAHPRPSQQSCKTQREHCFPNTGRGLRNIDALVSTGILDANQYISEMLNTVLKAQNGPQQERNQISLNPHCAWCAPA